MQTLPHPEIGYFRKRYVQGAQYAHNCKGGAKKDTRIKGFGLRAFATPYPARAKREQAGFRYQDGIGFP